MSQNANKVEKVVDNGKTSSKDSNSKSSESSAEKPVEGTQVEVLKPNSNNKPKAEKDVLPPPSITLKVPFYTKAEFDEFNLREFIKLHFSKGSCKMDYAIKDLHILLDKAKPLMEKSSSLIELKAPVNVCGDIHGQYGDLMRIFNVGEKWMKLLNIKYSGGRIRESSYLQRRKGQGAPQMFVDTACGAPYKTRYLFLGDYVDRGRHSLEVITLLLACRIQFPTKIYLLRGNHELQNINKVYGFMGETKNRYPIEGKDLYDHFNEVFSQMPLAALISNRILCMHGGLSPHLNSLDDIRRIQRPLKIVRGLAQDLLWADPEAGIKGFTPNKVRQVSHIFGEDAVHSKCKQLDIDMVIRAHQVVEFGYSFFAQRSLITVFSASRYHEELLNYAAVVQVDKNLEISFAQFKPQEFEIVRKDIEKKRQATANENDDEQQE